MTMQWSGTDDVDKRMAEYARRVRFVLRDIAAYWAPQIETYAKENAPWVDRTGVARMGLKCEYTLLSNDAVAEIILHHSVDYGLILETKWAGRYAIIYPTLQTFVPPIRQMVKGVFG